MTDTIKISLTSTNCLTRWMCHVCGGMTEKDPVLAEYAELLYGQAVLAEGGQLDDPGAFSRKLAELMVLAL